MAISPTNGAIKKDQVQILNRADEQERSDPRRAQLDERRLYRRFSYRLFNVEIIIEHQAGGSLKAKVFTRNLSSEGVAVIHNGFVHKGSITTISLKRGDGKITPVRGRVANCRHITGTFHELGVRFDSHIDPVPYLEAVEQAPQKDDNINLKDLHARILALDDDALQIKLLQHTMREMKVDLIPALSPKECLEILKTQYIDIFLTDLNLGEAGNCVQTIVQARQIGFAGPIVLVTVDPDIDLHTAVLAAGANEVHTKPIDQARWEEMIVRLHKQVGAIVSDEPIFSPKDTDSALIPLLTEFSQLAKAYGEKLEQLLLAADAKGLRETTLTVMSAASGLGYRPLVLCAEEIIKLFAAKAPLTQIRPLLRQLSMLCRRLEVRKPRTRSRAA